MSSPAVLSSPILPYGRMISGSPSVSQLPPLQPQTSMTGFRLLVSPSTDSPSTIGHMHGAGRANDNEYFKYMYSTTDFHSTDRRSAMKIAKTSQRNVRGGRLAAQARIDQCVLILRVLNEELEDWKWKEVEAEHTLWLLEHGEGVI